MHDVVSLVSLPTLLNPTTGAAAVPETEALGAALSIGTAEVYSAAAAGLRPDLKFVLRDVYDYANQPFARYAGVLYKISRTYIAGHKIELTLTRPAGLQDTLATVELIDGDNVVEAYAAAAYLQLDETDDGGVHGLMRELHLIVSADAYTGQEVLRYDGRLYAIIRAYQEDAELMDLYVEERAGLCQ